MNNIDISTILPLLMGKMGGASQDPNTMLINMLMDKTKCSPADKYFNKNGGPCPPDRPCQKPEEKPCGFSPIVPWCGSDVLFLLACLCKNK